MGANTRSKALPWLAALATLVLLAVLLLVLPRQEDATREPSQRAEKSATPESDTAPPLAPSAPPQALAAVTTDAGVVSDTSPESQPPDEPGKHPVDLAKLRERLPGNL